MFGNTRSGEQKVFGGFGDEYNIKEPGVHPIRFLAGPVRIYKCFLPIIGEDDSGEERSTFQVINKAEKGTVLDALAAIDLKIKREMKIPKEEQRSIFKPGGKFAYLGFPRETKELSVQRIVVPWTIADELRKKQEEASTKKRGRLMYGLFYMWDALCKRSQEKGRSERFGTSYSVDVDNSDNPWAHLVPAEWLPTMGGLPDDFDAMDSEFLKSKKFPAVFTSDELVAIEDFLSEQSQDEDDHFVSILERIYKPASNDEILEFFSTHKLDVSASFYDGQEMFPNPDRFLDEVNKRPQLAECGLDFEGENGVDAPFQSDEDEDAKESKEDSEEDSEEESEPKRKAKKLSLKDKIKKQKEEKAKKSNKEEPDEEPDDDNNLTW